MPANSRQASGHAATIHWQGVTLGEAVARIRPLFPDRTFLDRRIDFKQIVQLDIEAKSAEEVCWALAEDPDLRVFSMGGLVYLSPSHVGDLRVVASSRQREATRLPGGAGKALLAKSARSWARLTEPRELIRSIAAESGWEVVNTERIAHDLWESGELPELTVAQQLSVLLFGFGLTYELNLQTREIVLTDIVAGEAEVDSRPAAPKSRRPGSATGPASKKALGTEQLYTLRVRDKPVGAVLQELSARLKWPIHIDEEAIRKAGKSLDQRVTFSVEKADREKVLDALLSPAGLEYTIRNDQIRVFPKRYGLGVE